MSLVKEGVVKVNVTPSERSGKPSTVIKKGQALTNKEKPVKQLPININDIPLN